MFREKLPQGEVTEREEGAVVVETRLRTAALCISGSLQACFEC